MFFEFNQNNSGGSFDVNDKVCHRLFIEASSHDEATEKAESLGCYWNGVADGMDCSCCGDRWSDWNDDPVDIEEFKIKGYQVSAYNNFRGSAIDTWKKKYGTYQVISEPVVEGGIGGPRAVGSIGFKDIEEYAQYLADEHGWTVPDARIFYLDGRVKEIFSVDKS